MTARVPGTSAALEPAIEIGYALSSEEYRPLDLVRHARGAEEAGFTFALVSDHFHPWIGRQGQSPFVWSVIGAIAVSTNALRVGTGVTCPMMRTHPAVIAQVAATSAAMLPGRFFLGIGTGENLNEHALGDRWPSASERREMLEEAVHVMRLLWDGELTSFEGKRYRVDNARIYTLPDDPIDVMVAGGGPEAAELAARIGDGLVSTAPEAELVGRYEQAGGAGPEVRAAHGVLGDESRGGSANGLPVLAQRGAEGPPLSGARPTEPLRGGSPDGYGGRCRRGRRLRSRARRASSRNQEVRGCRFRSCLRPSDPAGPGRLLSFYEHEVLPAAISMPPREEVPA